VPRSAAAARAAGKPLPAGAGRARLAVGTIFFVNGLLLASWLPHIPAVKARLVLSDAELGWLLLAMAAGAVGALPLSGWLIARNGSRRMTSACAIALCLALPLPVLAPTVALAALALLLLGAANALLDVSMNAQAVEAERHHARAIMSSFHALFSAGGLAGAALASAAMAAGAGDVTHVVVAATASLLTVAIALPALLPSRPDPTASGGPVLVRPRGRLAHLGALAFCGLVAEGAIGDWSAVYLRDGLGTSPALAALGFAAFSLAMAAGRCGGDALVRRFGAERVLRSSALVAAAGLAAALIVASPTAGIVGFGLVGIGIANVIPILFSAAGGIPHVQPGMGIAAVATAGYAGFLTGPPVIGFVSDRSGIGSGMAVVSALCAVIACAARAVRSPSVRD
jgi:fucose permease